MEKIKSIAGKVNGKLRGWKTRILCVGGAALIVLIQLGHLDAANYDRLIHLATMLGMITMHSAVVRR